MSTKITREEFSQRINRNFVGIEFEILEYNGISNFCKIKCKKCGKIREYKKARDVLMNRRFCCELEESSLEKIKRFYADNDNYELIKYINDNNIIIKCKQCGLESNRTRAAIYDSPYSCKNCDNASTKQKITKEEIQKKLNSLFLDREIECLEYNGQLRKATYKCKECGLIFKTTPVSLAQSRGCPKCDKKISKGEKAVEKWLIENSIQYKTQIRFSNLNGGLSSYDFGIYNENNLIAFIEVQGRQHYQETNFFDSLGEQQRRDKIKKEYADSLNIPIIYIPIIKSVPKNLDDYLNILKCSTTILNEE